MYAVVKTGGKQYRVAEGERLDIERVPGETVTLQPILLVDGSDVLSTPAQLSGASSTSSRASSHPAPDWRSSRRDRRGHERHFRRGGIAGRGRVRAGSYPLP